MEKTTMAQVKQAANDLNVFQAKRLLLKLLDPANEKRVNKEIHNQLDRLTHYLYSAAH